MSAERVLPPDVFDALELSALAFGGIGSGKWFETPSSDPDRTPVCYVGHLVCAGVIRSLSDSRPDGIEEEASDIAVAGVPWTVARRIPFAEWCRRLNVVRGSEPTFDPALFPPRRARKAGAR